MTKTGLLPEILKACNKLLVPVHQKPQSQNQQKISSKFDKETGVLRVYIQYSNDKGCQQCEEGDPVF